MLSRDADSCFWIGRYVERAEATARMVDVHYHAALEPTLPNQDNNDSLHWQTLLAISSAADDYAQRYGKENDRDILHYFAFDEHNANSIVSCWTRARENARSIREQLASEMWESLNIFYLELRQWNVDRALTTSPHEFFQMVKNASHLFQGILNRTMIMGETRDWLDAGRFLERGGQTARLLNVKYHDLLNEERRRGQVEAELSSLDMHGWIAVLKSVSAFEMYRKTYRDGIKPTHVVDFLVMHPQFPASVRHCIARVEGCLKRISGNQREEPMTEPERLVGRLRADLTYTQPEEIIRNGLHAYLERVQDQCAAIGAAITRTYLSY
jgi:uncharacterized alpha-E superfamily protein